MLYACPSAFVDVAAELGRAIEVTVLGLNQLPAGSGTVPAVEREQTYPAGLARLVRTEKDEKMEA